MRRVGRSLVRCVKSLSPIPAMTLFFSLVLAGLFAPAASSQDKPAMQIVESAAGATGGTASSGKGRLVGAAADDNDGDDSTSDWNGTWVVEGTFFSVAVTAQDGLLKITQVESLGFKWESKDGVIDGNVAWVDVDYAGIEAVARVELVAADTAVVTAASCVPELMVVCVLTKNRMAVFRKVQ